MPRETLTKMEAFRRTCQSLTAQLTRLASEPPGPDLPSFLSDMEALRQRIEDNHADLIKTCGDDELATLIDSHLTTMAMARDIIYRTRGAMASRQSPAPSLSSVPEVRLPPLRLPTFSGTIAEWPTFAARFQDSIATHPGLTESQKILFLQNSLQGPAKAAVAFFPVTPGAYQQMWACLEAKFNRQQETVYTVIYKLFDHPVARSPADLELLADVAAQTRRALALLGFDTEGQDHLFNAVLLRKLDPQTLSAWQVTQQQSEMPATDKLLTFITQHSRAAIPTATPSQWQTSPQRPAQHPPRQQQQQQHQQQTTSTTPKQCVECKLPHAFNQCPVFTRAVVDDRWTMTKKHRLCHNCLQPNHATVTCRAGTCRHCQAKHHTLLHKQPHVSASATTQHKSQLLATALIEIKDSAGKPITLRAMVDAGSQVSLLTRKASRQLALPTSSTITKFATATGSKAQSHGKITCEILSHTAVRATAELLVVPTIATELPHQPIQLETIQKFIGAKPLADPSFHTPGPIDVLLGLDIYSQVILPELSCANGLILQNTTLGWILLGTTPAPSPNTFSPVVACTYDLNKFWEIEDIPAAKHRNPSDQQVLNFYKATTTRNETGRFVVRMPLNSPTSPLGASRHIAVSRLHSLERKFKKDPSYATQYNAVMDEYLQLGHLEAAPAEPSDPARVCYLPHHAVTKRSSQQLRVVFDASAKTSSGKSLNDWQETGPNLQDDIFTLLVRFRKHPVALTADIEKMYRQIELHPSDRDLQRIVWRQSPDHPIADYCLTTVTFGERAAPFLAINTLQTLAELCADPTTARVLASDLYVDDLLTGAATAAAAIDLQKSLQDCLHSAHLPTHKWASNDPSVLTHLQSNARLTSTVLPLTTPDGQLSTLGVSWNTACDTFIIRLNSMAAHSWTRRSVLSAANSLFDPLGWIAPVTVTAKMIMQRIVQSTTDWDDALPSDLLQAWTAWTSALQSLTTIAIPRCIQPPASSVVICGFADASERAYGAVVYLHITSAAGICTRLVAAKTRVVPLKPITIPRLELLGALLLARLIRAISAALGEKLPIHAWTDSTVTLCWLRAHPSRWRQFVANRVAEIQEIVPSSCWNHVRSEDNPADLASRGVSPGDLSVAALWWTGPPWLPTLASGSDPLLPEAPECRPKQIVSATLCTVPSHLDRFIEKHSFRQTVRIMAIVVRFGDLCRKKHSPSLQPSHFVRAEAAVIKWVQLSAFPSERTALAAERPVPIKSKIAPLQPYLDALGVMRVGGRLRHAQLPACTKNPMILPSNHPVTSAIISDAHITHLHAGPTLTNTVLRRKYWVLNANSCIKKQLRLCVPCTRDKAKLATQLMASLPPPRVTPSRPFSNCGVDFAGPVSLKTPLARGSRTYKAYIALFICFATRAVHLELVTALSTPAFLASFSRFTSRRGLPANMHSDQGTNFVGAAKLLKDESLTSSLASQGVTWHFNPPSAPHFGGLWEAGVKSTKTHLRRVIGHTPLTYEEFYTVLCRVEAVLNSRPLCQITDDIDDLQALTPAHFLVGGPLTSPPEDDVTALRLNSLSRWQLVQKLSQDFWRRWAAEYLSRLQHRPKWWRTAPNLAPGTLVLIHESNRPALDWRMGRITAVHPGADGAVRAATVKTAHGEMQRPIHKLCPLPLDHSSTPDGVGHAVTTSSTTPHAVTPSSTAPHAVTPPRTTPHAVTPSSTTPHAVTPSRATPHAVTPSSTTPHALTPPSTTPPAVTPSNPTPLAATSSPPSSSRPTRRQHHRACKR